VPAGDRVGAHQAGIAAFEHDLAAGPARGPTSTTWSAAWMKSGSCSITISVLPLWRSYSHAKIFPPRYGFSRPLSHEQMTGVVSLEAEDKAAPLKVKTSVKAGGIAKQ